MDDAKARRTVIIANHAGMHIRPVSLVAKLANQFRAKVEVIKDNQRANAKSVLEMLSLGGRKGEEFLLEATGEDAEAAVDALARLFANKFHEDEMDGAS
jgi:phosphotransferase system HPr (HPr) family protein